MEFNAAIHNADKAAVGTIARQRAVDGDAAPAVINLCAALGIAYQASAILVLVVFGSRASRHGSCRVHVLDSGSIDIAERGAVLGIGTQVEVQRVTVAVELALKGIGTRTHHRRDTRQIVTELVLLVAAISIIVIDIVGESQPLGHIINKVWAFGGTIATQRLHDTECGGLSAGIVALTSNCQRIKAGILHRRGRDGCLVVATTHGRIGGILHGVAHRDVITRVGIGRRQSGDAAIGQVSYILLRGMAEELQFAHLAFPATIMVGFFLIVKDACHLKAVVLVGRGV